MALDSLLAAIDADGRTEIANVHRDAERTAAERVQAARETAARAEAELARLDPAVVAEGRRRRSAGVGDATRTRAVAEDHAWRTVHGDLAARIVALRSDPLYPAVLRRLLADTLTALPQPATVRVHPADADLAVALVARDWPGADVRADLDGTGVEVTDRGGRLRARATLEDRLVVAEPALRRQLRALLHHRSHDDAHAA